MVSNHTISTLGSCLCSQKNDLFFMVLAWNNAHRTARKEARKEISTNYKFRVTVLGSKHFNRFGTIEARKSLAIKIDFGKSISFH